MLYFIFLGFIAFYILMTSFSYPSVIFPFHMSFLQGGYFLNFSPHFSYISFFTFPGLSFILTSFLALYIFVLTRLFYFIFFFYLFQTVTFILSLLLSLIFPFYLPRFISYLLKLPCTLYLNDIFLMTLLLYFIVYLLGNVFRKTFQENLLGKPFRKCLGIILFFFHSWYF